MSKTLGSLILILQKLVFSYFNTTKYMRWKLETTTNKATYSGHQKWSQPKKLTPPKSWLNFIMPYWSQYVAFNGWYLLIWQEWHLMDVRHQYWSNRVKEKREHTQYVQKAPVIQVDYDLHCKSSNWPCRLIDHSLQVYCFKKWANARSAETLQWAGVVKLQNGLWMTIKSDTMTATQSKAQ